MICEVIYGPRLDNDVDHQVLENLADRLLSDSGPDLPKLPSYPEKGRTATNKYISNLPIAQTGEISEVRPVGNQSVRSFGAARDICWPMSSAIACGTVGEPTGSVTPSQRPR